MNEEFVENLMHEISKDPQVAKFLLDMVERCITIHRCVKKSMMDMLVFSGPFPTKEGGETILEALQRKSGDDQEKHKLSELQSYWLANYEDIVKVIKSKKLLR